MTVISEKFKLVVLSPTQETVISILFLSGGKQFSLTSFKEVRPKDPFPEVLTKLEMLQELEDLLKKANIGVDMPS